MCVSAAAPVGAFLLVCTTRGQPGSLRPVTPNVIVSFTGTSIWASGDPSRIPSYGLPGAVSGSQVIFALLERRKSRYVQHALSRSCGDQSTTGPGPYATTNVIVPVRAVSLSELYVVSQLVLGVLTA